MLRVYLTSLLLIALLAVSCGQNKNSKEQNATANESGKDTITPTRFSKLIPKPIGNVSDYVHLFTNEQKDWFTKRIADLKEQTSAQMAVVVLDLDTTQVKTQEAFDSLSLQLVNQWGIGEKKKKNGVAFVMDLKLRMIRLHVGDDLLLKLTNRESKKIIDEIVVPRFKEGKYFEGMLDAIDTVIFEITYESSSKSQ